ncbi:MAG: cyclic nucleotide-binding domain-containing protein [Actinomycetota bacterium]|nr:cyclic nucleotide-binding domain-containing protein [Actinomycetota bacterium]
MPAPVAERVKRLREISIFRGLSDSALRQVARALTEFEAKPGQIIVEARTSGSGMFIITDGTVAVDARRAKVELGPGAVFGELALLTDQKRTARVSARTDVRGFALSRRDFTRLIEEHPKLALGLLQVLAERLTRAMS